MLVSDTNLFFEDWFGVKVRCIDWRSLVDMGIPISDVESSKVKLGFQVKWLLTLTDLWASHSLFRLLETTKPHLLGQGQLYYSGQK